MIKWTNAEFNNGHCWKKTAGFTVEDALSGYTHFDLEVVQETCHIYREDGTHIMVDGGWVINVTVDENPWCVSEGPYETAKEAKRDAISLLRSYAKGILKEVGDE